MAKDGSGAASRSDTILSIIGPGMHVLGDCKTKDKIRIEGVIEGSVYAEKAVLIGRNGRVTGDITTQEAVIAGSVTGEIVASVRLELRSTSKVDGELRTACLQLEAGGKVNGTVNVGRIEGTGAGGGIVAGKKTRTAGKAVPPRVGRSGQVSPRPPKK